MFKKELKKRILVVVGAALMACSLFACGGDKKASDTTAAVTTEKSKDSKEEKKTEEKKDEKKSEEKTEDKKKEEKKEETTEAKKEETTEEKKEEAKKEETTEELPTEEGPTTAADADEPVSSDEAGRVAMNYIGNYACGNATAEVNYYDGEVSILITMPYNTGIVNEWSMSGKMDPNTRTVSYQNCIKIIHRLDPEEGEPERESEYKYGEGMISFADTDEGKPTFAWYDVTENAGADMDFEYAN